MNIKDVFPKNGEVRRLYCDSCDTSMDLVFNDFSENVSGVQININGLPYLYCHQCTKTYLTDDSRFVIIELHKQAMGKSSSIVNVTKKKHPLDYHFTDVPFLIDADDYYYLPGLHRQFDKGVLTPLFFNKTVLVKFDNLPAYNVRFASQSYGTIDMENDYISFGINRHGKIIMWLGDVAKLPEAEQYYLRSENVPSDHSIGSEFYDGQIECKFTDPPIESLIIKGRSAIDKAFSEKFDSKLFHLDDELIDTISSLTPPLVDTEKERKHIFDSLNRIFVEAIDNKNLEKILAKRGLTAEGTGALKRLQAILAHVGSLSEAANVLMPFYVLYDLRVAYSHLTSASKRSNLLKSSESRLSLPPDAELNEMYGALVATLNASLEKIKTMLV